MTALTGRRTPVIELGRAATAILLPLGPAAVAVLRFLIPSGSAADAAAADPGRYSLIITLGVVATLTLVPGVYAALTLIPRNHPVVRGWIGAMLIPGYLALAGLTGLDAMLVAGAQLQLDPTETQRLYDGATMLPPFLVLFVVFLVGHIVGTVLLGIACYRLRLIPRTIAVLLAVSQPLHLTAVILGSNALDLVAWLLTALGMAFIARAILRP